MIYGARCLIIQKWLVNPELYTVTVTVPAPGEQEVHDAALAASLAEIKAAMTPEEIQAIIDATKTDMAAFVGDAEQSDDITMLALRRLD